MDGMHCGFVMGAATQESMINEVESVKSVEHDRVS